MNTYHIPVMADEVMTILQVSQGKSFIDATLGGGGYAFEMILRGCDVLGIDQDREAIEHCRKRWNDLINETDEKPESGEKQGTEADIRTLDEIVPKEYGKLELVQGNFRDMETIARDHGFTGVNGVLFDLGVSSHQLDEPGRGFGYRHEEALLDLRFDQTEGEPARELINRLPKEELYEIFSTYGEEKLFRPITDSLLRARAVKRIRTVGDLTAAVRSVTGGGPETTETLSRVFQALRIVVNDELSALKAGLHASACVLGKNGRIAVLTYHSLEDRIVKLWMRQMPDIREVTKKPLMATDTEIRRNRRARSAKLRVGEKA